MMTVLHSDSKDDAEQSSVYLYNNNNNEYLECLTHIGPKCLHILYKHILSKFNAYNMNTHTYTQTLPPPLLTHTHTSCIYHGRGTEEKVFKKRKLFKED